MFHDILFTINSVSYDRLLPPKLLIFNSVPDDAIDINPFTILLHLHYPLELHLRIVIQWNEISLPCFLWV